MGLTKKVDLSYVPQLCIASLNLEERHPLGALDAYIYKLYMFVSKDPPFMILTIS